MPERYLEVPGLPEFAEILATRGVDRGLIGPREVPRIWTRHIVNCAVVALEESTRIPVGVRIADVGSGAGLPGIVWALVRPDVRLTLVEPLLRRAAFLTEVVAELDLGQRVTVERARAEDVRTTFPVVTARAVARLPQLLAWTIPLADVGGWVIALKGASAPAEVEESEAALRRLGGGPPEIRRYGDGVLDPPTVAVLVERIRAVPPPSASGRQVTLKRSGRV